KELCFPLEHYRGKQILAQCFPEKEFQSPHQIPCFQKNTERAISSEQIDSYLFLPTNSSWLTSRHVPQIHWKKGWRVLENELGAVYSETKALGSWQIFFLFFCIFW